MQAMLIDALDQLQGCATDEARWTCGARLLHAQGAEWITAGTATRRAKAAIAIRSTTPDLLMRDYVAERIYDHDPWMQLCAETVAPDQLDVEAEAATQRRPGKARMSRLFADHGIRHAVLVPSWGGNRPGGIVLYACHRDTSQGLRNPEGLARARLLVALLSSLYRPEHDRSDSPRLYALQDALSPREREVLAWLGAGLRTSRIAQRMGIEDVTVSKHLRSIRRKLGARTREEALAIALRDGLIAI
jgi:DNA-binding CsgD family transcriptional regulator